jgi:hypothetical protein
MSANIISAVQNLKLAQEKFTLLRLIGCLTIL